MFIANGGNPVGMHALTTRIQSLQTLLQMPWEQQASAFLKVFADPLVLVSACVGGRTKGVYAALAEQEVQPLSVGLRGKLAEHVSDLADVVIETRSICIEEICEQRDPRNGAVQEGLAGELLQDLLDRCRHLDGYDVSRAESWVWYEAEPYPIIEGQLHFRPRKSSHFLRPDLDRWAELPIGGHPNPDDCFGAGLDFVPAKRFSLVMPDGAVRSFDVATGFV